MAITAVSEAHVMIQATDSSLGYVKREILSSIVLNAVVKVSS